MALIEGLSLRTVIQWGAAVGALSTTRPGAQPTMPSRLELEAFLKGQSQ